MYEWICKAFWLVVDDDYGDGGNDDGGDDDDDNSDEPRWRHMYNQDEQNHLK